MATDTFLNRLLYVLNPTTGDPESISDRAGPLAWGAVAAWLNGAASSVAQVPAVPAGLPAWLGPVVGFLVALYGAYHIAHADTGAALKA